MLHPVRLLVALDSNNSTAILLKLLVLIEEQQSQISRFFASCPMYLSSSLYHYCSWKHLYFILIAAIASPLIFYILSYSLEFPCNKANSLKFQIGTYPLV